mmetsp:Transcript_80199/g.227058  ORF Transcript_80199/g.227058 Transcript_80199/m.227058 type:complete len:200 (-) Transcript_80199:266-865(-)
MLDTKPDQRVVVHRMHTQHLSLPHMPPAAWPRDHAHGLPPVVWVTRRSRGVGEPTRLMVPCVAPEHRACPPEDHCIDCPGCLTLDVEGRMLSNSGRQFFKVNGQSRKLRRQQPSTTTLYQPVDIRIMGPWVANVGNPVRRCCWHPRIGAPCQALQPMEESALHHHAANLRLAGNGAITRQEQVRCRVAQGGQNALPEQS